MSFGLTPETRRASFKIPRIFWRWCWAVSLGRKPKIKEMLNYRHIFFYSRFTFSRRSNVGISNICKHFTIPYNPYTNFISTSFESNSDNHFSIFKHAHYSHNNHSNTHKIIMCCCLHFLTFQHLAFDVSIHQ